MELQPDNLFIVAASADHAQKTAQAKVNAKPKTKANAKAKPEECMAKRALSSSELTGGSLENVKANASKSKTLSGSQSMTGPSIHLGLQPKPVPRPNPGSSGRSPSVSPARNPDRP